VLSFVALAGEIVRVTDGNRKEIHPDGTFVVNGETLGTGRWVSESRFSVQVANWGGLWWVGELTDVGMLTTCVQEEAACVGAATDREEKFYSLISSISPSSTAAATDSQVGSAAPAQASPTAAPMQVQNLVAMGFPQDQCEAALRASGFDCARAVDYLIDPSVGRDGCMYAYN
jgi:hypothetical protein